MWTFVAQQLFVWPRHVLCRITLLYKVVWLNCCPCERTFIVFSLTNIFSNTKWFRMTNIIQCTLSLHYLLFVYHYFVLFVSLLHSLTNLLTQIRCFGSSVVTVISVAHFSVGVNFPAFVWMAHMGAPLFQLTCNLDYFFEILYSSYLWDGKILYFGGRWLVGTSGKFNVHPLY